jgi:hypothetical protein
MSSSTFDLVFRTDDVTRWGDGKGSNLTPTEVDLNFWILLELIIDLQNNPTQPNEIISITSVDNELTITLADSTTWGPFPLPLATWTWRGNWAPNTAFEKFDLFNQSNGLYLVLQDHTSNSVFDSEDGNIAGRYYSHLIPYPVTMDIGFFFPGLPGTGIDLLNPMFSYLAAHTFFLNAELPLSRASVDVAFTSDTSFDIQINDLVIGSVDFGAADLNATFTFDDDVQFVPGDKLKVMRPTSIDATAVNLTVTFAATKGDIEGPSSS